MLRATQRKKRDGKAIFSGKPTTSPRTAIATSAFQTAAQVPMVQPAVALTGSGGLPLSVFVFETGRSGEGDIRRVRAYGLE